MSMQAFAGKFIFENYHADWGDGRLIFYYRVEQAGESLTFEEVFSFGEPQDVRDIPESLLTSIVESLYILCGISYWKLWCPKTIELPTISLGHEQVNFWNTIYTTGLGELYYKNNIDFRDLVHFPATRETITPTSFPRLDRSLVLIGGGKDSIVSAELLRQHGKLFDTNVLNPVSLQQEISQTIGASSLTLKRTLDKKIVQKTPLENSFQGHVPISVIYALTGVLVAALKNYRFVVVSNERSASEGNVEYLSETINHQWSKSLECERLVQAYIQQCLTPDITYFSLLRPLSEIQIAEYFSHREKYFSLFSSCNRNFSLDGTSPAGRWCGKCAKCAFVFDMLAAFLPKETMLRIFGKNMLADDSLVPTYRELLGLSNTKPFDCVGTPEETALAFYLIKEKGEYQGDAVMTMFEAEGGKKFPDLEKLKVDLFTPSPVHAIPEEFKDLLSQ